MANRYVLCPYCGAKNRITRGLSRPHCGVCNKPLKVPFPRMWRHVMVSLAKPVMVLALLAALAAAVIPVWMHLHHERIAPRATHSALPPNNLR